MKYKIIWMIDALQPGGAEQLMPSLLSHFNSKQFDIRVCTLQIKKGNPISKELVELGIPVDFVQIHSLKNPFNIFRILTYLRSHSPDLIHTQLDFSDVLGSITANLIRIPCVSTLHTLDVIEIYKFSALRKSLRNLALRNLCTKIIAVSEKTREHHMQIGQLPKEKIKTIYNGIQLSRFQKRKPELLTEIKRKLNLNPNHKIITTIAVLREPKGIQFMIDAMISILENNPDTTYLIVGDGDYQSTLRDLVSDRHLENHIVMTGHRTDIPEMLAISDLFVLPSLGDALPTVLIEALASRTPIVATDVGGIPEIIEHNKNGLLVPPADSKMLASACLQLLINKDEADRLSDAGLKVANARFSVEKQVKQLEDTYIELIKPNG